MEVCLAEKNAGFVLVFAEGLGITIDRVLRIVS